MQLVEPLRARRSIQFSESFFSYSEEVCESENALFIRHGSVFISKGHARIDDDDDDGGDFLSQSAPPKDVLSLSLALSGNLRILNCHWLANRVQRPCRASCRVRK